jgi:nuclear transport factor 2 (NTF2) superfamily protein
METKPPIPPFCEASARHKVRMAEDAWNTRDPDRALTRNARKLPAWATQKLTP